MPDKHVIILFRPFQTLELILCAVFLYFMRGFFTLSNQSLSLAIKLPGRLYELQDRFLCCRHFYIQGAYIRMQRALLRRVDSISINKSCHLVSASFVTTSKGGLEKKMMTNISIVDWDPWALEQFDCPVLPSSCITNTRNPDYSSKSE